MQHSGNVPDEPTNATERIFRLDSVVIISKGEDKLGETRIGDEQHWSRMARPIRDDRHRKESRKEETTVQLLPSKNSDYTFR